MIFSNGRLRRHVDLLPRLLLSSCLPSWLICGACRGGNSRSGVVSQTFSGSRKRSTSLDTSFPSEGPCLASFRLSDRSIPWPSIINTRLSITTHATEPPLCLPNLPRARSPSHHPEEDAINASLFLTTVNLGGVKSVDSLGAPLKAWLPKPSIAPDLVVIGVQECLFLDELRDAIHHFLGE